MTIAQKGRAGTLARSFAARTGVAGVAAREFAGDVLSLEQRRAIAEAVARKVSHNARVWVGGSAVRVYVSRQLSGGRQDMGYIAIEADGSRNYGGLDRAKAGTRNEVEPL